MQRRCAEAVSPLDPAAAYLDVLVLGQARGNAGEGVVVEVQLAQVGDVRQRAVLDGADLVVAQAQSAGNKISGRIKPNVYDPM